ncbi:Cell division protein FtsK [Olavius algarvensis Delta 1 endosymbiont]|nr:Cell division protein FtsK [Olavius algarvensis Delta 1 endosymbiont]
MRRLYNEMFMASDEEEANRILKIGIKNLRVRNLLQAPNLPTNDPLLPYMRGLAHEFGKFIEHYVQYGFFSAIEKPRNELEKKAQQALNAYTKDKYIYDSTQLGPILYKAFLVLQEPNSGHDFLYWNPYIESTVVTGLHPALLEMIRHQYTFQIYSFIEKFRLALSYSSGIKINQQIWQDACDFASIHYPLFGIIANQNRDLDTRVSSMGLLHLIGEPAPTGSTLSAKVLLRYETPDDDEMSDSDLFAQTRESNIISRLLTEYTIVHPYANDGMTIALLNVVNIQSLIAGVDKFVKELLAKQAQDYDDLPPYHLSLILFMSGTENQTVTRYIQEWRKRWGAMRENKKFDYYQRCRLSVSQRIVGKKNWEDDYLNIISKPEFETDVAILPHFIASGNIGNEFKQIQNFEADLYALKYPFIEMPRCLESSLSKENERSRIISNRQFRIASLYSEIGARFKHENTEVGKEHVVVSQGDYAPWINIVDRLHQKSSWVVCIDPSIDERLISNKHGSDNWKREIIGFASGLGAHGELNYTVSTERSSIRDIEHGIKEQLERIYTSWESEDSKKAAQLLVGASRKLSGLSLVKATGDNESVRDLIGYTLVRICLPTLTDTGLFLCDELISLDTFQHWFGSAENKKRTDLLRIVAHLHDNQCIQIYAQLIECKLAKMAGSHLEKARMQLENSLHHLIECFHPRQKGKRRFDQRYWWAQMLRLVASKSVVAAQDQMNVSTALERLSGGYFNINWQAMAVTFWTDQKGEEYNADIQWPFEQGEYQLQIPVYSCGSKLVQSICCEKKEINLPQANTSIQINTEKYGEQPESADNVEEIIIPNAEEPVEPREYPGASEKSEPESIDGEKTDAPVSDVKPTEPIPDRIFLGIASPNREIFWEFGHNDLTNRHILIFGRSGTGKTYAIQSILYELGLAGQNSVIIDYTNGFLPDQIEPEFQESLKLKTHLVRQTPLPINPFRKQQQIIHGFDPIPEDSQTVGGRVTSVVNSVYSSIGEQQHATLIETIADGLEQYGDSFNFNMLLEQLQEQNSIGAALANKLKPLVNMKLFQAEDQDNWKKLYGEINHRVNVMQLAGVPRDLSRITTEFVLWDLYDYAANSGDKNTPLPITLDEIQNLDHRLEAPLGKFLTEGRKFGLSLILATQTLSNLKADQKDRLFQASHKLFFQPAETEIKEYAKILEVSQGERASQWIERLTKLKKGECYSLGPSMNPKSGILEDKAFKIKIMSFHDRSIRLKV